MERIQDVRTKALHVIARRGRAGAVGHGDGSLGHSGLVVAAIELTNDHILMYGTSMGFRGGLSAHLAGGPDERVVHANAGFGRVGRRA